MENGPPSGAVGGPSRHMALQEALVRQEQEAKAAEAESLAQDLTERLRELRESRERRRQTWQL